MVDIDSCFFGGNVSADFIRIVRKDRQNTQSVLLYQNICYQLGEVEGYPFFIQLTECNYSNGALAVYPGTHNFGYQGDAGAINEIMPRIYPKIETSVSPDDILIMYSGTWH